jgi:hypoxanthine-guanine phosphoribosyltransferase
MISEEKMIICKEHKFTVLYDLETLQKKVSILAQIINTHYRELLKEDKNSCIVGICVLKGGMMFFSDLIRLLEFPF